MAGFDQNRTRGETPKRGIILRRIGRLLYVSLPMISSLKIVDYVPFAPGKPFYHMVTSYMVSLASSPSIFNDNNPMGFSDDQYIAVEGILLEGRHFKPHDVYQLAQQGHISQAWFFKSCCAMLANTAYESVKSQNDQSPEFEFFRHIRNASSHRNTFNFFDNEPTRPANWRGNTIDHTQKGKSNALFGTECFGTFMGMAEIIDLLKDIEQKI